MALINYAPPLSPYLTIIYQDDDIVVLDKPAGLLSVPGKASEHVDSLQTRVQRVFPSATVVHRLDMATSGIMLMALNKSAHRHLSRQFELRLTQKTYQAVIYGYLSLDSGEIELPLICDWPNRPKQMVDLERGKKALTRWQVIAHEHNTTRLDLYPITGRSHQLRVHMLSLGHPIIGDKLYAHQSALSLASRLHLHAKYLSFTHPSTTLRQEFHSLVPF
jgi:tRNA pseudouridine32 synthase / 23S rRNA pseudouridine746 synthase